MSKYIVGLNIGNHDSAACLIKDGILLSYAEQERFSRNKIAIGEAPIDALQYCLNLNKITLQNVDANNTECATHFGYMKTSCGKNRALARASALWDAGGPYLNGLPTQLIRQEDVADEAAVKVSSASTSSGYSAAKAENFRNSAQSVQVVYSSGQMVTCPVCGGSGAY
jgi:predicted NodU family carbamoyl transferase